MKKLIPFLLILITLIAFTSCEEGGSTSSDSFFTVYFDTDSEESTIESQIVRKGAKVVEPKDPVKANSVFKEWTLDGEPYDFSSSVKSTLRLKATYYPLYTVVYDTNGGSAVPAETVIGGTALLQPSNPVKQGTAGFAKWVRVFDDGHTEYYDFSKEEPVTSDMTLLAVYTDDTTYTVSFINTGSTTISSQTLKSGGTVIQPVNPEKEHTYFKEWVKVSADGTESSTAYNFSEPVTESFTLKAVYYTTYTVTFWSKGGTSPVNDVQYIIDGGLITEPAMPVNTAKDGFKGWMKLNDDGTLEDFDFKSTPVHSNLTFWATYYEQYTVTYKEADGTTYATKTVRENEYVPELKGPENGGRVFNSWVDENGAKFDFTNKITRNITLTAVYGYSVTFDSDGGDYTPATQYVDVGDKAIEPKTPEKAGTRGFMWWVTQDGNVYDFSTAVTKDISLKALYWPANLSVEDYSIYDDTKHAVYDEVRCIHFITKKLVNIDSLMNGGTDFQSVFGNTYTTDSHNAADATLLDIFTNALMTPGEVTVKGTTFNTSELNTYNIVSTSSIDTNNSTVYVNSIDGRRYNIDISGLKLKMHFYKYEDPTTWEEDQTVDISIKGTFLKNSDDRYEMHVQLTVNGKTYPVLHATATKSGNNGDDNILAFSYRGLNGYAPGISLW